MRVSSGGQGVRAPLKNHKNIGFPSNTGTDSLKITKLPKQHSMLGNHWPASETPFKWCFVGGPSNGPLLLLVGPSLPSSTKKGVVKKAFSELDPSDEISVSAHVVHNVLLSLMFAIVDLAQWYDCRPLC